MEFKDFVVHMVNSEGFWYGIFVMCVFYTVAMIIYGIKSAIESAAEERAKKARREERLRRALQKRKFINIDLSKSAAWACQDKAERVQDREGLSHMVMRRSQYARVS